MDSIILKKAMDYVNMLLGPLEDLYYHTYEHSLDVMSRAIELGKKEGLNENDLEILGLAGIFHDSGFSIQYDDNEVIGGKLARNFLKGINYPENKIKLIEGIIQATSLKITEPKNIYEKIIKDADVDNFGRKDFFDKGEKMKKELELIKKIKIRNPAWLHFSLELLEKHKYYTESSKKERFQQKQKNIKQIQEELKKIK